MSASASAADIVIDASVAVKWSVPEAHSAEARRFLDVRFRRHVPMLCYTEFGQTLWKKVHQRGEIDADDARQALRDFQRLPLEGHSTTSLLEPAFDIDLATGRTLYDSIYLALASALSCPLVTADQRLYNALQGGPFAGDLIWVADPI